MTIATPALALLPAAPASQVSPAAPAPAYFQSHQTPTDPAAIATELAAALSANFSEFSAFLGESDEVSETRVPVLRQIRFQELLGFAEPQLAESDHGAQLVVTNEEQGESAEKHEQFGLSDRTTTSMPVAFLPPMPAQTPEAPPHFVCISSVRLVQQEPPTRESRASRPGSPEALSFALQLKPAPQPVPPESDGAVFHLTPELQPGQPDSGQAKDSLQAVPGESQPTEPQQADVLQGERGTSQPLPAACDAGASSREENSDRRPKLRLPQPGPRTVDVAGQPLQPKAVEILTQPAAPHAMAALPGATAQSKESSRPVASAPPQPSAATAAETVEHARPVREIQLDIGPAGRPEVRLRVLERGGDVVVVARSVDQVTSYQLGERLSELTTRLSTQGFETESWTPATELASSGEASVGRRTASHEGSNREFQDQRRSAEGFAQGHENGRRRRGMPAWLEAIESNLAGQRAMKGARR